MYPAKCPACKVVNNLTDADLGITLKCGSCGEPFRFGDDIVAERKRVAAEKKRLAKEEQVRIDEQNRAAAEAVRVAAEIQAQAKAEEERERLAQYTPPDFKQPVNRPPPADYLGYDIVAIFLNLVGVVSIAGSIISPLAGAFTVSIGGVTEASPLDRTMYVIMFIGGFILIACGHSLRMLTALARNTAR